MLSFFYRYKNNSYNNLYNNLYDTNIQKYIKKIDVDLREKKIVKLVKNQNNNELALNNFSYSNYNFIPIVAFICFLAGYNLSKM
jgi:hypothetical protein